MIELHGGPLDGARISDPTENKSGGLFVPMVIVETEECDWWIVPANGNQPIKWAYYFRKEGRWLHDPNKKKRN